MSQLTQINHIVVLMLENRSFDHMLGFLYADSSDKAVPVYQIKSTTSNAYFMPGADPGEGYTATNSQLFNKTTAPVPPTATTNGFVTDYVYTLGWESEESGSPV